MTRIFESWNPEMSERFFDALDSYSQHNEKQPIFQMVHDIYKPLGGPLFAGFSIGKK
ncbi:hypothetical protein [Paenibacillus faecalis]|uniref:hypothetical protein n=1 Tax=Paenibacillus faecalis TaxID=2079532 RepID=UPI00131A4CE6|nr:hypothetical protein [Paenibacillus faecalis]